MEQAAGRNVTDVQLIAALTAAIRGGRIKRMMRELE
jgi:hypothetical protein